MSVETAQNRQPAAIVHADQTPAAARARVIKHLPASDAPALLKKRYQIINIWRPFGHPAYDWPLALCDYNSINPARDLVPTELRYSTREPGETYSILWDEGHKWKYYKGVKPDEAVLIKWWVFLSFQSGSTND